LNVFRHLAQKIFDRRQPACKISIQSDEKSDGASCAQALCGVALNPNTNDVHMMQQKIFIISDFFNNKH